MPPGDELAMHTCMVIGEHVLWIARADKWKSGASNKANDRRIGVYGI